MARKKSVKGYKVKVGKRVVARTRKLPRVIEVTKTQVGKTDRKRDMKRKAMPPGKRISKNGKIYYERRKNRSDKLGKSV